jgi:hypothetical protein
MTVTAGMWMNKIETVFGQDMTEKFLSLHTMEFHRRMVSELNRLRIHEPELVKTKSDKVSQFDIFVASAMTNALYVSYPGFMMDSSTKLNSNISQWCGQLNSKIFQNQIHEKNDSTGLLFKFSVPNNCFISSSVVMLGSCKNFVNAYLAYVESLDENVLHRPAARFFLDLFLQVVHLGDVDVDHSGQHKSTSSKHTVIRFTIEQELHLYHLMGLEYGDQGSSDYTFQKILELILPDENGQNLKNTYFGMINCFTVTCKVKNLNSAITSRSTLTFFLNHRKITTSSGITRITWRI